MEVSEPPFNSPLQERVANQQIAFPCPAKGEPALEEIPNHTPACTILNENICITENICIMAIHLHDNGVLGTRKKLTF